MREIKISKNPYKAKNNLFEQDKIVFEDGITVLVGANGMGKSTLLSEIKKFLNSKNIPCYWYNQEHSVREYANRNYADITKLNEFFTSSEGERVNICINDTLANIGQFIVTGYTNKDDFLFEEYEDSNTDERWILLDSIDAGLSIDSMGKVKSILNNIVSNPNVHIIMSTNNYEFAMGQRCFDVRKGQYIEFKTYEDYRKFIQS